MTFPHATVARWTAALLALGAMAGLPLAGPGAPKQGPAKWWAYVGTYTGKESKGIYRFDFDPARGQLSGRALAAEVTNPSFLAVHPNQRFLYAVGELGNFAGKKGGAVSAFAIDPKTGDLKLLNQQSSVGAGPCHLVVDKEGKAVLAANYSGGSVCVLPIAADGSLGEASAFMQHKGSSVNKQRQEAPHAHSVNLDPANRFAFVADLGLDRVLIYRFDAAKGTLQPNDPPAVAVAAGAGPRHFAFHPNGKFAYVINELDSTVTALAYDADRGALKPLQTVSTLPEGGAKGNSTAEVVVHPSGKFVYGSNRGHNSIAVFTVDPATGKLTPAGHQGEGIKTPRNFVIDPTGQFLVVANQGSGSLVVFRIDPATGALTPTGSRVEVPAPVCVRFVPQPR
jgi:6-phosphogluconolactonase